jgi:DNA-binding transcriptional ArsR family regulator
MYAQEQAGRREDHAGAPTDEQVSAAVDAFRVLGDPTRLRLAWLLAEAEYDVTTLANRLGVHRPAVSQHLARMRHAGLVTTRREGRRVLYRLPGAHIRKVVTEALFHADHEVFNLAHHDD